MTVGVNLKLLDFAWLARAEVETPVILSQQCTGSQGKVKIRHRDFIIIIYYVKILKQPVIKDAFEYVL